MRRSLPRSLYKPTNTEGSHDLFSIMLSHASLIMYHGVSSGLGTSFLTSWSHRGANTYILVRIMIGEKYSYEVIEWSRRRDLNPRPPALLAPHSRPGPFSRGLQGRRSTGLSYGGTCRGFLVGMPLWWGLYSLFCWCSLIGIKTVFSFVSGKRDCFERVANVFVYWGADA